MTTIAAQHIRAGLKHLRAADPTMKRIIKQVGPFQLRPRSDRFVTLVRGIVGQQISTKAADSIFTRLEQSLLPHPISAVAIEQHNIESLREVGLSKQKASYILDLAAKVHGGELDLTQIARHSDDTVIQRLTQVHGVGPWSAKMFLIFALGRLDVMAEDDLGIRNAIKKHYDFQETPTRTEVLELATLWAPYRTIASWYLWRSLEEK